MKATPQGSAGTRRSRHAWGAIAVATLLGMLAFSAGAAVTVQSLDAGWQFRVAPADASAKAHLLPRPAADGIGGPHAGLGMIWPMSTMVRALTSDDPHEIGQCLHWLADTDAGTGFMHEAVSQDDPAHFTRAWFAWANSLFGELIVDVAHRHPALLQAVGTRVELRSTLSARGA